MFSSKSKKNKAPVSTRRKISISICVLLVVAVVATAGFLFYRWYEKECKFYGSSVVNAQIGNNIAGYNFSELQKSFPDIVAWLVVPGTNIDMPITQSPTNDYYYLTHGPTQEVDMSGSAYIELCNNSNFEDKVSVVYGHYLKEKNMFSSLHYFEDKSFFEQNDKFYIYTPGHKKTYSIVSAYGYNDSHILNTFDFSDKKTVKDYYDFIMNPISNLRNVRNGEKLLENDKIVQLSTCMTSTFTTQRYLVSGKLVNDEATN